MQQNHALAKSIGDAAWGMFVNAARSKAEEAGKNIEAFQAYVRRLVGSEIAQIILAVGLKKLCAEVQREYEQVESHFSLLDTLYEIKFKLLASSSNEKRPVHN